MGIHVLAWILWVETVKRRTRAAYGSLVAGQCSWEQIWTEAHRLYSCFGCDTKSPLQLENML